MPEGQFEDPNGQQLVAVQQLGQSDGYQLLVDNYGGAPRQVEEVIDINGQPTLVYYEDPGAADAQM